ncbi:MAG: GNAT family N-acetyltransferase [Fimbriimonadaceae bacterium]|nr:GNAT family N-acetyltransferase [Fimbriimonadaceae bacterium]QYK57870.1 MAG: GNAT family N-acetyltransferase [Fimbriimonadaceae bacterium]
MTCVRTLEPSEAEPFLSLLCRVFDLDLSRARSVFYSEPLYNLGRKWALFEDGEIRSILTTTGLEFGWGRAIGIAGVATDPVHRGRSLARHLIEEVLQAAEAAGEGPAILFAQNRDLYLRCGFEEVDEVVRGPIEADLDSEPGEPIGLEEVRQLYARWAAESPERLVRTQARWEYWVWSYRPAERFGPGYICVEPSLVREAVPLHHSDRWPVSPGTEWVGLRRVIKALSVPVGPTSHELVLMGRGLPGPVQMFMTDQF